MHTFKQVHYKVFLLICMEEVMERVLSVEDKIRRAEERYYSKREGNIPVVKKEKSKKVEKRVKKLIKQIIICLIIYGIFYLIINNDSIFSKDFTNKAREILEQDINFGEWYSAFITKINEITKKEENDGSQENNEENLQNNDENIGGAVEDLTQDNVTAQSEITNQPETTAQQSEAISSETEPQTELSQMEQDANYIKSTINFIKPVEGTISSEYGLRNPTTPTVPKNHTGTDIAAVTGTKIVSATDGKVILSSSEGDFGNHLKIQVNDVIIVYAHCNKLYVKEGDTVVQGQEIAEVGSTGNTTGPHLHFEIRYQDRYVDPQLILEL